MNRPRHPKDGRFRQTTYRDGTITESDVTEEQVLAIDPQEVDFFFNEATGRISIRKQDGQLLEYFGRIPNVGDKNERFLTEMMYCRHLITPRQIAPVLGMSKVYEQRRLRNAISALLSRLREGFGEQKSPPWFFLSRRRPFAFGWNPARTWCLVEKIAEPTQGGEEGREQ